MGSLFSHIRRFLDLEIEGLQNKASSVGFRVALFAGAGVIGLLGLFGLELAAFLGLATVMAPPWAALVTAVATFVIAGIIALVARSSTGEVQQHEIDLRKAMAKREMKRDVDQMVSMVGTATSVLAALKNLRQPKPAVVPVPPAPPGTKLLPPPPPSVWQGNTRTAIIAGVSAVGFALGFSPALRRGLRKLVS